MHDNFTNLDADRVIRAIFGICDNHTALAKDFLKRCKRDGTDGSVWIDYENGGPIHVARDNIPLAHVIALAAYKASDCDPELVFWVIYEGKRVEIRRSGRELHFEDFSDVIPFKITA